MQASTLGHWADELARKVNLAASSAADCIQKTAIGTGSDRHAVASAAESSLRGIQHAAEELVKLRSASTATGGIEIVERLESFASSAKDAGIRFKLYSRGYDDVSADIGGAMKKFAEDLESLTAETDQLMSLPEVQEARLSHRASLATTTAGEIKELLEHRP